MELISAMTRCFTVLVAINAIFHPVLTRVDLCCAATGAVLGVLLVEAAQEMLK